MELFDLLETRVVELLGQIDTLREENKTLQEKVNALDEENKTLKESLEQEQHTKEEINGRIDTLLSTIREFTAEPADIRMHSFQLNVLGMDISFRTDADSARIERAQAFVEKQYERLKNQGGQFGREKLLTLLVLGVADDLLQTQQQLDGVETRLANLLELIEKTD